MYLFKIVFFLLITFFGILDLQASDLGGRTIFHEVVENIQKANNIDLNKVEVFKLDKSLIKLTLADLEKKIPYSFSKKYIIPENANFIVVILNVFNKPSIVKFKLSKSVVVRISVKLDDDLDFDKELNKMKPLFGAKPKVSKSTNIKSAEWSSGYEIFQYNTTRGKKTYLFIND